jgi:hypothetical protein
MSNYLDCNSFSDLYRMLANYKIALDASNFNQRSFVKRADIYAAALTRVQAFAGFDMINQRIRTEQDIARQNSFTDLAIRLQDLTRMMTALAEFKATLDNNDVMISPNLSAQVPRQILQNFELSMHRSYKNMAELADTINCESTSAGRSPPRLQFTCNDILLLTNMLKSAKNLYIEPENGDKLIAFSN